MIGTYRKKPVVIEAVQWTGDNPCEIQEFAGNAAKITKYDPAIDNAGVFVGFVERDRLELSIQTLEGEMKAAIGDYIIKGVNGEFYPCKEEIFEKTYDLA
ncbi:MAG: hypothetical protein J6M59_10635 [Bacteroidaceae bacterium]|nr:hypothetical protein [Bacteroidaceae bacterium]